MPFGLKNAGQSLQRLMDRVGAGLDFVFIYMDDILVASVDEQSHLSQLRQLLERLHEFGLVLNLEKCQFGRAEVDFLGHRISAQEAEPLSSHLSAIQEFGKPADIKALESFLGLVNFYRHFIPGPPTFFSPSPTCCVGASGASCSGQPAWTRPSSRPRQPCARRPV